MRAVVGLGNPGSEYAETRHNLGFQVADRFAFDHNSTRFEKQGKMLVGHTRLAGQVLVVKPLTYMNLSGEAVHELLARFPIADDGLVVAHDDLDLELGDVKIKIGGGHGGNNGIRSILARSPAREFVRVRLGIRRPDPRIDAAEWVLSPFADDQRQVANSMIERGSAAVASVLRLGAARAMNRYNRKLAA